MEPNTVSVRLIFMTDTQPQGTHSSDGAGAAHHDTYTLQSPAHLIASLPGTLGYFPTETVSLITLQARPGEPDILDVGPYLCSDLGSTEQLRNMLEQLPITQRVATFGVIISRVPDSEMVKQAIKELRDSYQGIVPLVDACWLVSEVADGTPYRLAFSNETENAQIWGWEDTFTSGTVASVIASPAMRPYIDNGLLPELDRADTFEHFDPLLLSDAVRCDEVAPAAYRRGLNLMDLVSVAPALARRDVERACELFVSTPADSIIDGDGYVELSDVFQSDDEVELIAAMLSRSRLRDCLIVDALAYPFGASAVMLCIARNFTGAIRANALCLWAMVALSQRLYAWAGTALRCADEEVPGHALSNLLLQVMLAGKAEEILEVSSRACRDTWLEFGG